MLFERRVVAITGAAGGIGKELCRHFGGQGAAIAALDRREAVTTLADELRRSGIKAESAVVDVGHAPGLAAAFARLIGLLGPIDILINNAGVTTNAVLERTSPDGFSDPQGPKNRSS